jgi:hypothetical protein
VSGPRITRGSFASNAISLWPVLWMTSPTRVRPMMLKGPLDTPVLCREVVLDEGMVVLVRRESGDAVLDGADRIAVDVVGAVFDVGVEPESVRGTSNPGWMSSSRLCPTPE